MKIDKYTCSICGREVIRDKKAGNMGKLCNTCRQHYRQLKLKNMAIDYLGGKCKICGYNKCIASLEFHHRNPEEKLFTISTNLNKSWDNIVEELDKCDLLCSNCHRELHYLQNKRTSNISEYEEFIDVKFKDKIEKSHITKDDTDIKNIKHNITSDNIEYILNLYQNGNSAIKISLLTSICYETVINVLHSNGVYTKLNNEKRIGMFDLNNVLIKDFYSISEAASYAEETFKSRGGKVKKCNAKSKISKCINGRQYTSYNYIWRELK